MASRGGGTDQRIRRWLNTQIPLTDIQNAASNKIFGSLISRHSDRARARAFVKSRARFLGNQASEKRGTNCPIDRAISQREKNDFVYKSKASARSFGRPCSSDHVSWRAVARVTIYRTSCILFARIIAAGDAPL